MGTPGYMSPEQARGQVVDKRTDIWAFGCVLYEMLTGHVAFKGDTMSDTIVAVLGSEPDWDALPARHQRAFACCCSDASTRIRSVAYGISVTYGSTSTKRDERRARDTPTAPRVSSAVLPIVVAFVLLAAGAGLFYSRNPPRR